MCPILRVILVCFDSVDLCFFQSFAQFCERILAITSLDDNFCNQRIVIRRNLGPAFDPGIDTKVGRKHDFRQQPGTWLEVLVRIPPRKCGPQLNVQRSMVRGSRGQEVRFIHFHVLCGRRFQSLRDTDSTMRKSKKTPKARATFSGRKTQSKEILRV
jgi:hypothetical protein